MRSSRASVDLIVTEEVSSKEVYEAKYQHPEWPGGSSGVTVGIGYDLGYSTPDQILSDWKDYLPPDVIQAMQTVAGVTGQAAFNALHDVRGQIVVPWDAAMAVFMKHDMPKWEAIVVKAIPGSEALPAGCFGVLTGLAYNRGASFSKEGDRYREMRDIRMHVMSGEWDKVPADLISMKRLWPNVVGLRNRRQHEADLWSASLAASHVAPATARVDTGDDKADVTPVGNQPDDHMPRGQYSPDVEAIQTKLDGIGYHEVGTIDGIEGGKLRGAIAAFLNDRGKVALGRITPEFRAELNSAMDENWTRPISQARSTATASDLAPKIPTINHAWWQKVFAYIIGAPAFLTAGFKGVFGDQPDPLGAVTTVKNFFGAVPPEYYWLAVGGLAVAIFYQASKSQAATVKAYQEGKIN